MTSEQNIASNKLHFWLRDEIKPGEKRTPILPEHAKNLLSVGHLVTVEESVNRCIPDEEYSKVGCRLVPSGSWTQAPKETVILGLKELPDGRTPLHHRHIYFAHVYKEQSGWKDILSRFVRGNGLIWDLEYLTDETGRRVAAFGRSAGFIGMAAGVINWCHQQLHPEQEKLPSLQYHNNFSDLVAYVKPLLAQAIAKAGRTPQTIVIGALGRSGSGACAFAEAVGLTPIKWDINETAGGGPFFKLIEIDILVNCIYLMEHIPPFLTLDFLNQHEKDRKVSVVVDVSCDPNNPWNPLPIYNKVTTFFEPNIRVVKGPKPVDVIAIDHLPSLVPFESSKEFADTLINHLAQTDNSDVWHRARQIYNNKIIPVVEELEQQSRHIWLRDEISDTERRTPLVPSDAKKLVDEGFRVTVEKSLSRVFPDEEYAKVGCEIVESGSWKEAPDRATVLGLQGLNNEDQTPLKHRHMHFAYAFKEQSGWRELLSRFVEGGGSLLDLEYLLDDNNKRLTSFAKIAGYIGMAAAILVWCHQQIQPKKAESPRQRRRSREGLASLVSAEEIDKELPLLPYIQSQLEKAARIAGHPPVPVIIGANGKVGSGAALFAKKLGLHPALWTREDTKSAGPQGIPELLEYDVLVNGIKLDGAIKPFLTKELIHDKTDRTLSVIVDISCDYLSPHNPLPIYSSSTSFAKPTQSIIDDPSNPLDILAIENLGGLLPRESSINFSAQLIPLLLHIAESKFSVWNRALSYFSAKTKGLQVSSTAAAPTLHLPTDFHKPHNRGPSATAKHVLSQEISQKLREHAKHLRCSLENLVLTAFKLLIYRLSGEEDVIVGILKVEDAAERLANILTVRSNLAGNPVFTDILSKVNTSAKLEELRVFLVPVANLLTSLKENHPKFQVLFTTSASSIDDSQLKQVFDMFDFTLALLDRSDHLEMQLIYRSDVLEVQRPIEVLSQIQLLLEQLLVNAADQIQKYTLITPESKKVLPVLTDLLDNTWFGSICEHFGKSAARVPNKVALVHHEQTLTYKELDVLTSKLANYLVQNGINKGDSIFIFGNRNLSMVWAVMGILRAGGAVSLMDPVYPPERIVNCLEVAQPRAWICVAGSGPTPKEVEEYLDKIQCNIRISLPLPKDAFAQNFLKDYSDQPPNVQLDQDDIAVITFTSGSTGLPKGVLGRHGPLTHFYPWMSQRFGISENDHFTMCSGISHDPLQRDIFTPLFFGATLHIPNAEDISNPGQLALWMRSQGVTITHLTPAMGQLLSETTSPDVQVPTLRLTLLVGDKLTKRDVYRLRKVAPQLMVVNMYGSTETQRAVSYFVVPPNNEMDTMKEILPAGQGMKDAQLIIFNADNQLAGIGEIGEIYMRSPHLAKGYKGLPEQTAAKFLVNPFSNVAWDRFYRTGDLGRYKLDGTVEVAGRADNQVKIRGFRIELGEINTMLSQHKAVKENVPMVREDAPGDKRIVAYVVPHPGYLLPPGHELRRFLENKLPYYMIPSAFVVLKSLPLTPNGKINHGALPAPERVSKNRIDRNEPRVSETIVLNERSFVGFWKEMFPDINLEVPTEIEEAPKFSDNEKKIADIWAELLGTSEFGPHDSFFDLGGHSLLATRMVSMLRNTFQLELPIDILLKNPTIAGVERSIERFRQNPNAAQLASDVDLEKETVLDPLIVAPEEGLNPQEYKNILLTGSTGFLGIFILKELLQSTNAKIFCLVRANSHADGKQRVQQNLKIHRLWDNSYDQRIIPIPGDLTKPNLGVDRETYQKLAESIDCIVHNAAFVHWIYPYEQLKPHNVIGTQEVLRLAATKRVKPVHHVSTTSVFDGETHRADMNKPVMEDDPLESSKGLHGGYPQSKWVAERLVMEARKRGIPGNIYRPGYVGGDTTNGIWTTDDFLCRVIKGCVQLGLYPDFQGAKLDILPVDYVARSIVQIALRREFHNKSFNVVNPHGVNFEKFFEVARDIGFPIKQESYSVWRAKLLESQTNSLAPVASVFTDNYISNMRHPPYDRTNMDLALGPKVPIPSVESSIAVYFSYFIKSGFLAVPSTLRDDFRNKYLQGEDSMDLVTRSNRSDKK